MSGNISVPSTPIIGGCQCGAVRYQLSGFPLVFYICHCTNCQKQSSSALGQSLRVQKAHLHIEGDVKTHEHTTASGVQAARDFCPKCGTRLFHRRTAYSDTLNIKAGSLDDTSWLKPAGHIWTRSKQPWISAPKDALSYEKQPENYDALIRKWQEMTGVA